MRLRFALLALSLAAAGCVGGSVDNAAAAGDTGAEVESAIDPVCPTAPDWPLSHFYWRTTRQLEHLVWSSDGKQVGGVEYVFEEKKS